jgi:hypothetical protein
VPLHRAAKGFVSQRYERSDHLTRPADQENPFQQADLLDPIEKVLEPLHQAQPVIEEC